MHADFIHLRVHSSYSLLEGAIKIDDLVNICKKYNMPAVAITDTGNLFASLEFSKACSDNGIQPIIGCTIKIARNIEKDKHGKMILDQILLIAKNQQGYQNLLKLVSHSFTANNTNDDPHINFQDLIEFHQGIICLNGHPDSYLAKLILNNEQNTALQELNKYFKLFKDNLYIEILRHDLKGEPKLEAILLDFAYNNNIPIVATNDAYFLTEDMYEAHDALLCISAGRYVSEDDRRKLTNQHYFKSAKQMKELFADLPEAIENTLNIARRCSVKSEESPPMLPNFAIYNGISEGEQLKIEAFKGLDHRLTTVIDNEYSESKKKEIKDIYVQRLEYELKVIIGMKFPGYFLIVSDFIKWSKRAGIPVGPGRGSGAGSVVAWCLEITELDPIKFGLIFERFLNPERISMPDFDIDFCQERRDEVIKYVQEKYGKNNVAQIITFGKLQARAVIRDVGRVLQLPYTQVDKISKMVPFNQINPVTLADAIAMEPMLKKARDSDANIDRLITIALKLEGLHRHASTHAAGIVISGKNLEEIVPLYKDYKSDMIVVQYSMKYAEAAGLVKFDFLGLKTLTVINNCCTLLKQQGVDIEINKISLEDQITYNMLSKGKSTGVFQFESSGMKDSLRKMKPDCLEDLIALGALYRPGPMDNIPLYIACKHGLDTPDYLHPMLKETLEETFGIIIYQEQVIKIAQILAGYTAGAADLLRRAMGKKIKAEMDAQRQLFVEGAIHNNVDKQQAEQIFDQVAKFAGYGFNKSHATAYALISYQTAYLKANFPVEFFITSMNLEINDTDKINIFCQEAIKENIKLLPPDINKSNIYFSIELDQDNNKAIRYGLGAIKNVGLTAMENLVEIRNKGGLFKDINNFIERVNSKVINKRQLESLTKVGAFDSIHSNRRQIYSNIEHMIMHNNAFIQNQASKQISLFGDNYNNKINMEMIEIEDWTTQEKLNYECEGLGFFLTGHPLSPLRNFLKNYNISEILEINESMRSGFFYTTLAGIAISTKSRVSPKGRFVSAQFSDPSGLFELSIFDDELLSSSRDLLGSRIPLIINAEAKKDEGGVRLTAQSIVKLDDFLNKQNTLLHIWLNSKEPIEHLKTLFLSNDGNTKLKISAIIAKDKEVEIDIKGNYLLSVESLHKLSTIQGILNLELKVLRKKDYIQAN